MEVYIDGKFYPKAEAKISVFDILGLPGWVPQLQLRQVEKASHWIVHEHPERVALELQRFLQSK